MFSTLPYSVSTKPKINWTATQEKSLANDFPFTPFKDTDDDFVIRTYLQFLWLPETARSASRKYRIELPQILSDGGGAGEIEETMMWYALSYEKADDDLWNRTSSIREGPWEDEKWRTRWLDRMERREFQIQILLYFLKLSLPGPPPQPTPVKKGKGKRRHKEVQSEPAPAECLELLMDKLSMWQLMDGLDNASKPKGSNGHQLDWMQIFFEQVVKPQFEKQLPDMCALMRSKLYPNSPFSGFSNPPSPSSSRASSPGPPVRQPSPALSTTSTKTLQPIMRNRSRSLSVTLAQERLERERSVTAGPSKKRLLNREVSMSRVFKPKPRPAQEEAPRKVTETASKKEAKGKDQGVLLVEATPEKPRFSQSQSTLSFGVVPKSRLFPTAAADTSKMDEEEEWILPGSSSPDILQLGSGEQLDNEGSVDHSMDPTPTKRSSIGLGIQFRTHNSTDLTSACFGMRPLGRASAVVSSNLKAPVSPRPFFFSFRSSISTTRSLPSRALSSITESHNDLHEYTSGRWVYNDALRHKERKVAFNVDGLRQLAAESVNRSPTNVVSISKLAEGGFNRTFVIALRDGQQVVARVPYPMTVPHYFAVASEVATIEHQRSRGIPVPDIYGYSANSDNVAGTPYILMEFIYGPKLSEVWPSLGDEEVISVIRQLTQLESRMMSQPLPAGGSLYFTKDLEKVASGLGVPLEDKRFCIGPDTKLALWYGRRAGLNVNRGPYHSAEAALEAAAQKEIAYLKHFGQPLLPLRRERRPSYKYQQQQPSDHVENLERYLSITSSLVPRDVALSRFYLRHPDLQPNNIFVSWSPGSDCKIVSLFDWQHTSILPMFLLAGIPRHLQNHADGGSQSMTPPSRPDNLNVMGKAQRDREEYRYRCRLVHYHYVTSTKDCNPLHHAAFTERLYVLRSRLFLCAGGPWEGETSDLKASLIQAANNWEELTGGGEPCPFKFNAQDLTETAVLNQELSKATRGFEFLQSMGGIGEEGWVPVQDYEGAVAFLKKCKEEALSGAQSVNEREEIMVHWPWDDMHEELYM
ncbi:hypothetical protein H0H93_009360 [Arthromyces matolae]|nr:hypothetical protein H0H93_009360 [Arthromyces matolae]